MLVYIDGAKCTPVRERIWPALKLSVGSEITCAELKDREKFHWKLEYQKQAAWEKEQKRLRVVTHYIQRLDPRLQVTTTGFGADTTALILEHPPESGRPDIEVFAPLRADPLMLIEVTGTERMRGTTYWVRPDKLRYAQNHPELDVWVILHYAESEEKLVFIKPRRGVEYRPTEKKIRGSTERYVEFTRQHAEVKSRVQFEGYLTGKIDNGCRPQAGSTRTVSSARQRT